MLQIRSVGLLSVILWVAAAFAGSGWVGDGRAYREGAAWYEEDPAAEFRAEFALPAGPVGDTDVTVACAGYFTLKVNGVDVGDPVAPRPLWSPVAQTVYSETFTVPAKALCAAPAKNEIRLTLGNGWYNLPPMKFFGRLPYGLDIVHGRPCFKVSVEGVGAPLTWTWRETNIRRNCLYLGAEVDGTFVLSDDWRPAVAMQGPSGRIVPRRAPSVARRGEYAGVSTWREKDAVQVVDFGVNRTGVPRFDFTGVKRGTRIEIVYGERLNGDGTVDVMTQVAGQLKWPGRGGPGAPRLAAQRDVFVVGDDPVFVPPFVWHVCRYAQVVGCDKLLDSRAATFIALASDVKDLPSATSFVGAKPEYDAIHALCRQTFLDNIMGVQSDCPGRERLGYGGDIVATCEAFMLNFDMREFYLKTLQDFADEAAEDGWLTETAPYVGVADKGFGGRSGPISWSLVVPVLMEALMRHYPDVTDRALGYYPVCARYVRLVEARCPDGIVPQCIGDHEALERAPDDVVATAHWHRFVELTARFARQLGKVDEAMEFESLAKKIRGAFAARFVRNGIVGNGTQSAQSIALYLGLVPEEQISAAEQRLAAAVEEKGGALSTGLFTTRYLLMYLTEHGRRDLAERIVLHRSFPGWLHMIDRGSTTVWETWRESDNLWSNCHPMFGSVDEWILRYGGIPSKASPEGVTVSSPGEELVVAFSNTVNGLSWSLARKGRVLVKPSRLGVRFCNQPMLGEMKVVRFKTSSETYNETTVELEEVKAPEGFCAPRRLNVVLRAYDEGIAFRYVIPEQPAFKIFEIANELTEWRFGGKPNAWTTSFASQRTSEEETYEHGPFDSIPAGRLLGMPVLVETEGQTLALCEAALSNWAGQFFRVVPGASDESVLRAELATLPSTPADTKGAAVIRETPAASPWRVAICAEDELGLIGKSGMVKALNPPPDPGLDFSWVRTGASSWDWWAESNNSLTTELTLGFVDFAAEMGWPYHTIDGGWYGLARRPNHGPNVRVRARPEFDLARIVRHGWEKGVGIIVWIHWMALDENGIDDTFAYLEGLGVKGVKLDFLERQDQWMVCWTEKVLRSAARHHLVVNLHGSFHPSGTEKTWPNNLTREAIRGNEMSLFNPNADSRHSTILPFTRFLLGPGDYTPGSFANVYAKDFKPIVGNGHRYGDESQRQGPKTVEMGTRAQSLARCIAFDSPLMTLCDWPERYRNQPGLEVLKSLPAVWKRTIPVAGKCGEYYAVVRESFDGRFYFAALTDKAREIELDLGFLGEGEWQMATYADTAATVLDAKVLGVVRETVARAQHKAFKLLGEGGAVAVFTR